MPPPALDETSGKRRRRLAWTEKVTNALAAAAAAGEPRLQPASNAPQRFQHHTQQATVRLLLPFLLLLLGLLLSRLALSPLPLPPPPQLAVLA